jgi:hypothetical protein
VAGSVPRRLRSVFDFDLERWVGEVDPVPSGNVDANPSAANRFGYSSSICLGGPNDLEGVKRLFPMPEMCPGLPVQTEVGDAGGWIDRGTASSAGQPKALLAMVERKTACANPIWPLSEGCMLSGNRSSPS